MRLVRFAIFLLIVSALVPVHKACGQQNLLSDSLYSIPPFETDNTSSNESHSVGAPRYTWPTLAHYRLFFGVGGNYALRNNEPLSYIGSASYQLEHTLFGASFISNTNPARQIPRHTLSEFDLLYGYSADEELTWYEASPQSFHVSLSTGIGLDVYSTRWRFGRQGPVDSTFRPNTFEYSLALPIQLQAIYEPFRFAGIGATLFLSVSKLVPSYGAAVSIEARY
jgi:hypothetical protein